MKTPSVSRSKPLDGPQVGRLRGGAAMPDSEALNYVLERVDTESQSSERLAFERLWFGNYSFFAGAQFAQPGRRLPAHIRAMQATGRMHQANLILPKVYRAVAKLLQINPAMRVAPKSAHRDDRHAAKVAEKVYKYLTRATQLRDLRLGLYLDAALYGSSFMKITWDTGIGRPYRVWLNPDGSVNSEAIFDPEVRADLERNGSYKDIPAGDVSCAIASPFQIHWPTDCRGGIKDCQWLSQVSYITPSQALDRYDIVPAESEIDSSLNNAELYERAMSLSAEVAAGITPIELAYTPTEDRKRVREIEFWERPSRRNAMHGRRILIVGNTVIHNTKNPYAATENPIPFEKQDWFPIPGKRFIGLSLVEQLRNPQVAYNMTRIHEIGFQRSSGHANVFLPKNSGVMPLQVAGFNGRILEINMNAGAPVFSPVPQLPPYIGELRTVARGEMDAISAQTEPSNSKLPGQVRSGSGIGLMLQDQNLILTPTVECAMTTAARIGSMMLSLVGAYYTTPRVLAVLGRGNEFDPITLLGSDLRGHTNLQLTGESTPIESSDAYRSRVMDAVELGILDPTDPADKMLITKALEFNTADEIYSTKILQEISEEREISRMVTEASYMPEPKEYHDAEVRMRVLERELNSRDFESYPTVVQQKIELRWRFYVQVYRSMMEAQMKMMQMMNGTPGQSGAPSRPKRASA